MLADTSPEPSPAAPPAGTPFPAHLDFPPPPRDGAATLSPVEKAVAVMSAMGKPVASRLVGHLSPDERAAMLRAADALPDIDPRTLDTVVAEFEAAFVEGAGASDNLAALEDVFEERLADAGSPGGSGRTGWDAVAEADGEALATKLEAENPQLAALALARLPAGKGAGMLRAMEPARASLVLARMAERRAPAPAVMAALDTYLAVSPDAASDPAPIAAVLNELERDMAEALLTEARLPDPTDARVRGAMFAFDDLGAMGASDLALVLDDVAGETLAVALHGAADMLVETVLSALSPRTRRMVEAQRRTASPTPDETRAARRDIARRALTMMGEGRVTRLAA